MKIALIGTGNLGLSIAKGLVINNTYTTLYLTKRNLDSIESWTQYKNVFVTSDNKIKKQKKRKKNYKNLLLVLVPMLLNLNRQPLVKK